METLTVNACSPQTDMPKSLSVPSRRRSYLSMHSSSDEGLGEREGRPGNPQLVGKVVRVEGDGRCLFRSLVTAESHKLQVSRRNEYGRPESKEDAAEETFEADVLRARVVRLMWDNLHFYSQLENGLINADQPFRFSYQKFLDRLEAMSKYSTMPGDLELNAAAMVLERQIIVLDTDLRIITVYGQDRYPQSIPVAVRYTRIRPDVGHYDAVVLDASSDVAKRGISQVGMGDYSHLPYSDFSRMSFQNSEKPSNAKYINEDQTLSVGNCCLSRSSQSCSSLKVHRLHTDLQKPCLSVTPFFLGARRQKRHIGGSGNITKQNLYKSKKCKIVRKPTKKLRKRIGYKIFWDDNIPSRLGLIARAFSLGESWCVLCKKRLLSSIHSWMKCHGCGRVAHTDCAIKCSPCLTKNSEFYFMCQLCVLKKKSESE